MKKNHPREHPCSKCPVLPICQHFCSEWKNYDLYVHANYLKYKCNIKYSKLSESNHSEILFLKKIKRMLDRKNRKKVENLLVEIEQHKYFLTYILQKTNIPLSRRFEKNVLFSNYK